MASFRMIRNAAWGLAMAAMIGFAGSSDVQAQQGLSIVGGGHGHGGHGGFHGGGFHGGGFHDSGFHDSGIYGGGTYGGGIYGGGYGYPAHTWHDTSHFDYHPGGYVPHGNHYDYQPGHWDYHQQGHLHHNHW